MDIQGITKSLSILMTKAKPPLHVPTEPMSIVECLFGYVIVDISYAHERIKEK